jgi:hypothetical protein
MGQATTEEIQTSYRLVDGTHRGCDDMAIEWVWHSKPLAESSAAVAEFTASGI